MFKLTGTVFQEVEILQRWSHAECSSCATVEPRRSFARLGSPTATGIRSTDAAKECKAAITSHGRGSMLALLRQLKQQRLLAWLVVRLAPRVPIRKQPAVEHVLRHPMLANSQLLLQSINPGLQHLPPPPATPLHHVAAVDLYPPLSTLRLHSCAPVGLTSNCAAALTCMQARRRHLLCHDCSCPSCLTDSLAHAASHHAEALVPFCTGLLAPCIMSLGRQRSHHPRRPLRDFTSVRRQKRFRWDRKLTTKKKRNCRTSLTTDQFRSACAMMGMRMLYLTVQSVACC